jgi:antitoxin HicB
MQITWAYPAVFTPLDGEIVVRFPDIPEAITGAATLDEARLLAADALEEAILAYLAHGRPVPGPRLPAKGEELVPLDPLTAGRAAVSVLMSERHVNKVALAGMIGRDEKVVRRILDGKRSVTMENVTIALKALGARPTLAV